MGNQPVKPKSLSKFSLLIFQNLKSICGMWIGWRAVWKCFGVVKLCSEYQTSPPSHNWDTHLYFQLDVLSHCLDYLVQRRLEITAQYDLRCSLLADNVIRSTVQVTADSHSVGLISTICKQGKYTGQSYSSPYSIFTVWAAIFIFTASNGTALSMRFHETCKTWYVMMGRIF